jgi:hypothetical protein
MERLIEVAAEHGFIAAELDEGVGAAGIALKGKAEEAGELIVGIAEGWDGLAAPAVAVFLPANLLQAREIDAVLDAAEAAETPLGGGQLLDELIFEPAGGLVLGEDFGEEGEKLAGILITEDDLAGQQAVASGVERGAGLPGGRGGAGALAGIAPVRFDLVRGCHKKRRGIHKETRAAFRVARGRVEGRGWMGVAVDSKRKISGWRDVNANFCGGGGWGPGAGYR